MVPAALVRQELHSPDRLLDPDWERGPHGRGVQLPQIIDLGDVVGFRAVTRPQLTVEPAPAAEPNMPPPSAVHVVDWWGYLHAVERGALVLHGPHPTLPAAYAAAQHALAAQVWSQGPTNIAANRGPAGSLGAHPGRDQAWRARPAAGIGVGDLARRYRDRQRSPLWLAPRRLRRPGRRADPPYR